jgi:hypothetical protein
VRRACSIANPLNPPPPPEQARRELTTLFLVWLFVSLLLTGFAVRELSVPGLYYDEAVCAGQARDFLMGTPHGHHMPGTMAVNLFGRPFPLLVPCYFGALKSWLLIPSFAVFGPSVPVLRLTTLGWGLIALLFFMLWTHRLLGLPAALVAGPLLGLDPSYFFMTVHDWGPVVPGFLCRFAGFNLLFLWWQRRKWRQLFLASLFFGLGFFSKVDFIVILLGCGLALLLTHRREIVSAIKAAPGRFALGSLGFLLVAGPFLVLEAGWILQRSQVGAAESGLVEKIRIIQAMYDGSYFWRLMDVGGRFKHMFENSSAVWSPFGLVLLVAAGFLVVEVKRRFRTDSQCRLLAFLLLSALFITMGFLLLPGANRIHHALLVYPFPHLIITAALVRLWPGKPAAAGNGLVRRVLVVGTGLTLIAGHLIAIQRTDRLIQETGGRGWWSNALGEFCDTIKKRTELTIVSLDWGFNEQLLFLTDGPQLSEPLWHRSPGGKFEFPLSPDTIYLIHPLEYMMLPYGAQILNHLQSTDSQQMQISAFRDREGQVAFYAIWFVSK